MKDRLNRTRGSRRKLAPPVQLVCMSSTAPFTSWDSVVEFVPGPRGTAVLFTDDRRDRRPAELIARLPSKSSYRDYVSFLARDKKSRLYADFLDDGETFARGVDGVWAELMLMAWMHPVDDPPSEIALALLTLDDDSLEALRREAGAFGKQFVSRVRALLSRARNELRHPRLTLAGLLGRVGSTPPSFHALENAMNGWVTAGGQPERKRARRVTTKRGDSC